MPLDLRRDRHSYLAALADGYDPSEPVAAPVARGVTDEEAEAYNNEQAQKYKSESTKAFQQGLGNLRSSGFAARGLFRTSILGNEEEGMADFVEADRVAKQAQANGPEIQNLDQVDDVSSGLAWARNMVVTQAPNIAMLAGTGGTAGVARVAVGGLLRRAAIGGLAKAAAKSAAERVVAKQGAEAIIARTGTALAEGTGAEEAALAARQAVQPALQQRAKRLAAQQLGPRNLGKEFEQGAAAGGAVSGVGLEAGSTVEGILDPNSSGSLRERSNKAALGAIAAGSLEALPVLGLLRRFGLGQAASAVEGQVLNKFGHAIKEKAVDTAEEGVKDGIAAVGGIKKSAGLLARVAKNALEQGATEGATEGMQTFVERATHKWMNDNIQVIGPEAYSDYINAIAGGFIGGAVFGAPAGLRGGANHATSKADVREQLQASTQDFLSRIDAVPNTQEATAEPGSATSTFQAIRAKMGLTAAAENSMKILDEEPMDLRELFDNAQPYDYTDIDGTIVVGKQGKMPIQDLVDKNRALAYQNTSPDIFPGGTAQAAAMVPKEAVPGLLESGALAEVGRLFRGESYDALDFGKIRPFFDSLDDKAQVMFMRTAQTAQRMVDRDEDFRAEKGTGELTNVRTPDLLREAPLDPNQRAAVTTTTSENIDEPRQAEGEAPVKQQEVLRNVEELRTVLRGSHPNDAKRLVAEGQHVGVVDEKGVTRAVSGLQLGKALQAIESDPDFQDQAKYLPTANDRFYAAFATVVADMAQLKLRLDPDSLKGMKLGRGRTLTVEQAAKLSAQLKAGPINPVREVPLPKDHAPGARSAAQRTKSPEQKAALEAERAYDGPDYQREEGMALEATNKAMKLGPRKGSPRTEVRESGQRDGVDTRARRVEKAMERTQLAQTKLDQLIARHDANPVAIPLPRRGSKARATHHYKVRSAAYKRAFAAADNEAKPLARDGQPKPMTARESLRAAAEEYKAARDAELEAAKPLPGDKTLIERENPRVTQEGQTNDARDDMDGPAAKKERDYVIPSTKTRQGVRSSDFKRIDDLLRYHFKVKVNGDFRAREAAYKKALKDKSVPPRVKADLRDAMYSYHEAMYAKDLKAQKSAKQKYNLALHERLPAAKKALFAARKNPGKPALEAQAMKNLKKAQADVTATREVLSKATEGLDMSRTRAALFERPKDATRQTVDGAVRRTQQIQDDDVRASILGEKKDLRKPPAPKPVVKKVKPKETKEDTRPVQLASGKPNLLKTKREAAPPKTLEQIELAQRAARAAESEAAVAKNIAAANAATEARKTAAAAKKAAMAKLTPAQRREALRAEREAPSAAPVVDASAAPEYAKLPSPTPGKPTKTYAGVGSRETPPDMLERMTKLAAWLEERGYTLNTGDAKGADGAFRNGAKNKNVFTARDANDTTRAIAKEIHPAPQALSKEYVLNLMARNTFQVFGAKLDTPVDFVVVWTKDAQETKRGAGGTGQAMSLAQGKGIPVINMALDGWQKRLQAVLAADKAPAVASERSFVTTAAQKAALIASFLNKHAVSGAVAVRSIPGAIKVLNTTRSRREIYDILNALGPKKMTAAEALTITDAANARLETLKNELETATRISFAFNDSSVLDNKTTHKNTVKAALSKATNMVEALAAVRVHATPEQKRLIDSLARSRALLGVSYKNVDRRDLPAGVVGGEHNTGQQDTPLFSAVQVEWPSRDSADGRATDPVRVLLHEALHAATVYSEQTNPKFRAAIKQMMFDARKQAAANGEVVEGWYGLIETQEFIAEAFSNPDFQNLLRTMKPSNTSVFKSLWDQFKSAVSKLIGYDFENDFSAVGPKVSLLEEVMTVGGAMIQETAQARAENQHAIFQTQGAPKDIGSRSATPASGSQPSDYMTALPPHERTVLQAAFSRGDVYVQIKKSLPTDMHRVLASADDGPTLLVNTGIALALKGKLDINPNAKSVINQLYQIIRRGLDIPSPQIYANQILKDIKSHKRRNKPLPADYSVRAKMLSPQALKLTNAIQNHIRPAVRAFAIDVDARMRSTGIPAMTKLATLMSQRTGEFRADRQNSLSRRVFDERNKRFNVLYKALGTLPKDAKKMEAVRMALATNNQAPPANIAKQVKAIRTYLRDMRSYLDKAGVKMGNIEDYYPVAMDHALVAKDEKGFKELFIKGKNMHKGLRDFYADYNKREIARLQSEPRSKYTDQLIANLQAELTQIESGPIEPIVDRLFMNASGGAFEAQIGAVTFTDGEHDPSFRPMKMRASAFVYKYGTDKQKAAFAKYQDTNLERVLVNYTQRAVRRGEWERLDLGTQITALLDQAAKEGATPFQLQTARDYVDQIMGSYGTDFHPLVRHILETVDRIFNTKLAETDFKKFEHYQRVLLTYQNIRLLPLALMSSLVDPLGLVVRSGGPAGSWTALAAARKAVFAEGGTNALRDLAEDLGIVERHGINEALAYIYGSSYDPTGKTAKWNSVLFKYNGLEMMTRFSRLAALQMGQRFLIKHASGKNPNSLRYLRELNLKPGDIKVVNGKVVRDAKIDAALTRFVDESVVRPTPAQRPQWQNDPHFMLAAQYKGYLYSFWNTIIRRGILEVKNGNYGVLWPLLAYIPIQALGELGRDMAQGDDDDENKDAGYYMTKGLSRSGLAGPHVEILNAARGDFSAHNSPLNSIAGPTGQQMGELMDVASGKRSVGKTIEGAAPGSNLWQQWDN